MADIYVDNDVSVDVADRLRARGHTATTTRALRLTRAPDGYQLLLVSQNGWLFITHNRNDFELLHDAWLRWSKAWGVSPVHAGILVLPHGDTALNAQRVHTFIVGQPPLSNAFFEWTNGRWTPWQPKGGTIP